MAGLWDTWTSPGGSEIDSVSIITTEANSLISPIHDRLPVILHDDNVHDWLTAPYDPAYLSLMLKPYEPELTKDEYAELPTKNDIGSLSLF